MSARGCRSARDTRAAHPPLHQLTRLVRHDAADLGLLRPLALKLARHEQRAAHKHVRDGEGVQLQVAQALHAQRHVRQHGQRRRGQHALHDGADGVRPERDVAQPAAQRGQQLEEVVVAVGADRKRVDARREQAAAAAAAAVGAAHAGAGGQPAGGQAQRGGVAIQRGAAGGRAVAAGLLQLLLLLRRVAQGVAGGRVAAGGGCMVGSGREVHRDKRQSGFVSASASCIGLQHTATVAGRDSGYRGAHALTRGGGASGLRLRALCHAPDHRLSCLADVPLTIHAACTRAGHVTSHRHTKVDAECCARQTDRRMRAQHACMHGMACGMAPQHSAPSVMRNTLGRPGAPTSIRSARCSGPLMSVVPRALRSSFTHCMHVTMFCGVASISLSAAASSRQQAAAAGGSSSGATVRRRVCGVPPATARRRRPEGA